MSDKLKNILIGFFALLGIVITICTVLFLKPSIGDGKKILNVKFSNIQGLNIGTRVTFAGKPIGEVIEIKEVKDARKDRKDEFSRYYFYLLKLKVDSSVEVYNSDIVSLQTTGLMGEKSIAINPRAPKKGQNISEISNEVIYADSVDSFENTARQITELTDKFDVALTNFNIWLNENSKNITLAVSSFSNLLQNADSEKIVNSVNTALNNFSTAANHVNYALNNFEKNSSYENMSRLIDNLSLVSNTLNSKDTTIGKLLNSEDFYLNLNAILSKANTVINDINNYGVLFQYSKGWQRQRVKRANILEKLSTPKEFKEYFTLEVDEITASLGRLNRLIDLAKDSSNEQKTKNMELYKKDFANLMRQIANLSDLIKLYNENLFDKSK